MRTVARPATRRLAIASSILNAACFSWLVPSFCAAPDSKHNGPSESVVAYVLRAKVNARNWDDGGEISHFVYLHASEVFPAAILRRSGPVLNLPVKIRPEIGDFVVDKQNGADVSLRQLIQDSSYDGFIILNKGQVVYEQYPRMKPDDRHLAFSVTKAFVGTLIGILEQRRLLNLNSNVEQYLPELANTSWAGTNVRNIADMASGMEGVEDSADAYTDPHHKQFLLEASLGWQPRSNAMPDSVLKFDTYGLLASFKRLHAAGQSQEYASANTFILTEIIERVTGKRLTDVLSEEIWSKMGAEGDGLVLMNERGVPIAHAGIVLTLRDLARFGLLFTKSGRLADGQRVISESFLNHLLQDGRPALMKSPHPAWVDHASYQWDAIGKEGQLIKGGFADQMLYIDCGKNVVIAYFGTNRTVDSPPTLLPLRQLVARYF